MTQPRLSDLHEIEAALWAELASAMRVKGHAWRVGVLATRDGVVADARSVVLREVDPHTRTLLIYTDSRSPKAAQVQAHPEGTLVLWSKELSWQLRLRVSITLQTEGLAVMSRWARLKLTPSAQDYLSPLPPGSPLDSPGSPLDSPGSPLDSPSSTLEQQTARAQPSRESREHFAVIAASVQSIDWLELDARGHRRAVFEAGRARWVTP